MKKCKRWIAVLLVSVMCLSLCGCQRLDDMRAEQGVWQEDGTILWNENVYRLLNNVPESYRHYYGSTVYVTEADVPVLLSDVFGDTFTADQAGVMLHNWNWEGEEVYYCRADRYDYMSDYVQQGVELNTYFYSYYDGSKDYGEEYYYLTNVEKNVIDHLLNTLTFTSMDEEFYHTFEANEYCMPLGKCDETHLFSEDYWLEISFKNDTFYLVLGDRVGEVPADYNDEMNAIVKAFYKAEIQPYI